MTVHALPLAITPPPYRSILRPAFLLLLAFLLPLPRALAATITVDSDCSLANAIRSANGDSQTGAQNSCETGDTGADIISLGQNVTLGAALPDITSTITLNGNGRFISGNDQYHIFRVNNATFTLNNTTLRNALLTTFVTNYHAPALAGRFATISINNSVIRDNTGFVGGAVSAYGGTLTVSGSRFLDNHDTSTTGGGGALRALGGAGLGAEGTLTVSDSFFRGNQSNASGGAVHMSNSSGSISGSQFQSNSARGTGGAINLQNLASSGVTISGALFLDNTAGAGGAIYTSNSPNVAVGASAFRGNSVTSQGGAIHTVGGANRTVANSSFTRNRAASQGGAMFAVGPISLRHLTVVNNEAGNGGGLHTTVQAVIYNSVMAGNSGGDCAEADFTFSAGSIVNFWAQDGSCGATFSGDPMLAPARGSPFYFPPYIGSGLVDAAPDDANCLDTDQRGVARPVGAACDIGAYEGAVAREVIARAPRDDGPYIPPTPAGPTCQVSLNDAVSISGYLPGSECQLVSGAGIGNEDVIKAGPIAAVDVWSYIGPGVTVCFRGQGKVVLLDAATSPRTLLSLSSSFADGQTCAFLDRVGTVVLLPADSALAPPSANIATRSTPESRSLSDCMVTATHDLNFRAGPGGAVIGYVRQGWRLTAAARTEDWFQVDRNGAAGWISAEYVKTEGGCG